MSCPDLICKILEMCSIILCMSTSAKFNLNYSLVSVFKISALKINILVHISVIFSFSFTSSSHHMCGDMCLKTTELFKSYTFHKFSSVLIF